MMQATGIGHIGTLTPSSIVSSSCSVSSTDVYYISFAMDRCSWALYLPTSNIKQSRRRMGLRQLIVGRDIY